jgi:AcrR family transcriptional regulator
MPSRQSPADKRRSPAAPYHHGDLRRALTDAALMLVTEQGPKGFTLTEVARRAGVSAAAPYRHFADKSHLLATVAELGFRQLHEALLDADRGSVESRERLVRLGRAYVHWAVTHHDSYLVMFGIEVERGAYPDLVRAAERAFGVLLEAINAGREAGALRVDDPRALAGSLWSLVHGAASLDIGGDLRNARISTSPETLAATAITAMVDAAA